MDTTTNGDGAEELSATGAPPPSPPPSPASPPAPASDSATAPFADDRDPLVRRAELIISYVLRGGVLLSAAIILVGVVLYLFFDPAAATSGPIGSRPAPSTLGDVGAGLARGDPLAVIALGLLVLLATPVLRVAVSIVTFALERDRRFVAITSLVLLILVASFLFGKGGA